MNRFEPDFCDVVAICDCGEVIYDEYYEVGNKVLCKKCLDKLRSSFMGGNDGKLSESSSGVNEGSAGHGEEVQGWDGTILL